MIEEYRKLNKFETNNRRGHSKMMSPGGRGVVPKTVTKSDKGWGGVTQYSDVTLPIFYMLRMLRELRGDF